MECIPAIDLRQGRVVRLTQGDFQRVSTCDCEPLALARRYAAAGARRLHVVDLDGAAGEGSNLEVIRELCAVRELSVQAGGGVRDERGLETLFEAGVSAVVVGSLAVREKERVMRWLQTRGGERIVLALDVRPDGQAAPEVLTDAWRNAGGITLWDLVRQHRDAGLRKVLCTDAGRDGLLAGPNLPLYRECLQRFPELEWQASGGIGDVNDVDELAAAGVPVAVVGRALLEGRVGLQIFAAARSAA